MSSKKPLRAPPKTLSREPQTQGPLPLDLYTILACPACKKSIRYNASRTALTCQNCKTDYPIRNGIPLFLPSGTG